jgi:hypothetical protein
MRLSPAGPGFESRPGRQQKLQIFQTSQLSNAQGFVIVKEFASRQIFDLQFLLRSTSPCALAPQLTLYGWFSSLFPKQYAVGLSFVECPLWLEIHFQGLACSDLQAVYEDFPLAIPNAPFSEHACSEIFPS